MKANNFLFGAGAQGGPRGPRAWPRLAMLAAVLAAFTAAPATASTGVSDDRVSLPEGPGSLEGVGENVQVDPNMGLMRYAVPIQVPEGFSGLVPEVALSYSSGAGGSVVGMGWSLAFPFIERLTVRGLPEYDPDDEFCVGGSEQLVRIPGSDPPQYRARFEKGFVRYTWLGGDDGREGYWTAEYPDGRIGYFGADADGTLVDDARVAGTAGTFRYHLVEMTDRYDHRIRYTYDLYGNVTLVRHIGWLFAGTSPLHEVTFEYEDRQDFLSDCKPGFNELLEVRLSRINVLVRGQRIRRYDLGYENYATSGGFSRLATVTLFGLEGGRYPIVHTFAYSRALGVQCQAGQDCQRPYVVAMGSLGVDVQQGHATLLDINGDSLPDVLDTGSPGEPHRLFVNELQADGGHQFRSFVESAVGTESSHNLSSPYVQVLDVNGDGFTDLINAQTGDVLMNYGQGDWDPDVLSLWDSGSGGLPDLQNDFDPGDGELRTVRFLDYDGDKRIDLVRSQFAGVQNETFIFRNTGFGAFEEDPDVAQIGAGFESDSLELNDLNGDGLLDPVQVLQSELRYRLNLGWGQWADWTVIGGFAFTDQEAIQAELEDLNGDALADLVLVAGNEVRYWLNRNGASFDPEATITGDDIEGDIPVRDATTTVLYADMNGNGSTDIVWIDASGRVTYLEIFPVRPNLLARIENSLGRVTAVSYRSSVQYQALDGGPGSWPYALPHPMNVVESVDEYDELFDLHEVTSYTYHDGYYDGVEKDFRGYERVEYEMAGDDSQEANRKEDVFDVGRGDPYRNGLLLTERQYSDGRTLANATTTYEDCPVAEVPASGLLFPVRNLCKVSEQKELQEGLTNPADFVTTETRYTYDGYGNVTLEAALGVTAMGGGACPACAAPGYTGTPCGAACLGDEAYHATEYAVPAQNGGRWLLQLPIRERKYGRAAADGSPADDTYSEQTSYYDGPAFDGLPFGQATHGTATRVTQRLNAAGELVTAERHRIDEHGNVVETIDALGTVDGPEHRRLYTMDAEGLRVIRVEILLTGAGGPYRLRRDVQHDPLWGKVIEGTAWMVVRDGNPVDARRSHFYTYDEFGRITSHAEPGDAAGVPTHVFEYDLGRPTSRIVMKQRSVAGGPFDLETVRCLDGHGRETQTRTRIAGNTYKVSGFTVYNHQGKEREVYQPYNATGAACDAAPPVGTQAMSHHYDALGRAIRHLTPATDEDGRATSRTEYRPLAEYEYDPEDTLAGGAHENTPTVTRTNGLDKTIAIERLEAPGAAPYVSRFEYDALGNLTRLIDPAGNARVQTSDLLGRVVAVDDPDRGTLTLELDALGNLVRQVDARGVVVRRSFDSLKRLTAEWDEADPDGTRIEHRYDERGDCPADECTNVAGLIATVHYPLGDGTTGEDRFGYDVREQNILLARRLGSHWFRFESGYDNAGRAVSNRLPTGRLITFELDGADRLTAVPGYLSEIAYDARGQLAEIGYDNGVTTTYVHDGRMRLASLATVGPDGEVVLAYGYRRDRHGNVLEIEDGRADDGAPLGSARYEYDSLYRLTRASLDPGRAAHAEVLDIGYDELDNITSLVSDRGSASKAHVGTYAYGQGAGPHAVTRAGAVDYGYDAAGNLTARGDVTYDIDFLGRLTAARRGSETLARFSYGATSERLVKREGDHTAYYAGPDFEVRDGVAVTYVRVDKERHVKIEEPGFAALLYSDLAPAEGPDQALVAAPDGAITAGDAWLAQGVDVGALAFAEATAPSDVRELLAASAAALLGGLAEKQRYLHQDHLGGNVAVTDETGVEFERTEYYPYGLTRYETGEATDYGFTGKEHDESTGLTYFGARYLDPWVGRFTAPDPTFAVVDDDEKLGHPDEALGAYVYSLSNPVNNKDEDGNLAANALGAIIGAGVGLVTETLVQYQMYKAQKAEALRSGKAWGRKDAMKAIAKGVLKTLYKGALGALKGFFTFGASAVTDAIAGGVKANLIRCARKEFERNPSMGENGKPTKAGPMSDIGFGVMTGAVGLTLNIISGDPIGAISSVATTAFTVLDARSELKTGSGLLVRGGKWFAKVTGITKSSPKQEGGKEGKGQSGKEVKTEGPKTEGKEH